MRILLGDQTGRVQAEVERGRLSNVTWRLNKAGSATLTVARSSNAFRRELLEPGARIYVEFDNGLPSWGGILDLPRTWRPLELETRAYTLERLLAFQITPKTRAFYGDVVGSIFATLLSEADQRAAIGVSFGQVWMGGAAHWPRYHFRDMVWAINQSIRQMEMCDYRIVPYLNDGRIMFRCELHEQLGDDLRTQIALIEGGNVAEDATLSEQGDIVNRVAALGAGATWGEREVIFGVEDASRRRYGLREKPLQPAGVNQTATLTRYADNAIRESAYPHHLATMRVADKRPARYTDYDVGDIVRVMLPSYGFSGYDAPMRVISRGYDPQTGVCEVVCDERFAYLPTFQGEDSGLPGEETQSD